MRIRFRMNRRKFLKTVSFLAALPFLPKVVTKRLDSVVVKSEWGRLLAQDLRDVYMETGEDWYPSFAPSDKAMANILNSGFKGHYIKEEKK